VDIEDADAVVIVVIVLINSVVDSEAEEGAILAIIVETEDFEDVVVIGDLDPVVLVVIIEDIVDAVIGDLEDAEEDIMRRMNAIRAVYRNQCRPRRDAAGYATKQAI
jgi:hypothetical protein